MHHCDSLRIRDQLDVTSYYVLFHFTTVLQPATRLPPQPSHTETPTHIETIQQKSGRLLMMNVLMSETCWA